MSHEHTASVTLPASASLSKAGAVHHVALVMAFGEFLVYFIGQAINNTLICKKEVKSTQNFDAQLSDCTTSERLSFFKSKWSCLSDLAAVSEQHSSTPHGRCPGMCTPSCDPWHHGVCPTCRLHGASLHRWWYITPHGLHKERQEKRN